MIKQTNKIQSLRSSPFRFRRTRLVAALAVTVFVFAGCGGPNLSTPDGTFVPPTPTITVAAPTAAVGATTGAPCESGTLHLKDLAQMERSWRDGLAIARGRAITWQEDAVLIELRISCELFEAGFRWQTTYFSRTAQAYYRADTAEVNPVNTDPDSILALPENEIDFDYLLDTLMNTELVSLDSEDLVSRLEVRVSTSLLPIGPPGVPINEAIYHVAVQTRGAIVELYVDSRDATIYQFE